MRIISIEVREARYKVEEIKKLVEDYRSRVLSGEPLTVDELRDALAKIRFTSTCAPEKKKSTRTKISNEDLLRDLGL